MLRYKLIHPEIISELAYCGHGDKILIADGNYPLESKTGEDAAKVYLGLMPGTPKVTEVLEAVLDAVNVEAYCVMEPEDGSRPEVFDEFERMLQLAPEGLSRYGFYDACMDPDVKLVISTGEKRTFANILLTVGVA